MMSALSCHAPRATLFVIGLIGVACFSSFARADSIIRFTADGFVLEKGNAGFRPNTKKTEVRIVVGAPKKAGVDTFTITPVGGAPVTVTLDLNGTETAAQKATKLADALTAKKVAFGRDGTEFKFSVDKIVVKDLSEEEVAFKIPPGRIGVGAAERVDTMSFRGTLSGMDASGAEAVYVLALGLDKGDGTAPIGISASVPFGSLSEPTIGALLDQLARGLRSQLPESLQPNLVADSADDRILFESPSKAVNMVVASFTSDVTLEAAVGFVPKVARFSGSASRVGMVSAPGSDAGAQVRIAMKYSSDAVDLRASTVRIVRLLDELDAAGTGELLTGLPITLVRRPGSGLDAAIFETSPDAVPQVRLTIQTRRAGLYEALLRIDRGTIPRFPRLCTGDSRLTTNLATSFLITGGSDQPVEVETVEAWRCLDLVGGEAQQARSLRTP